MKNQQVAVFKLIEKLNGLKLNAELLKEIVSELPRETVKEYDTHKSMFIRVCTSIKLLVGTALFSSSVMLIGFAFKDLFIEFELLLNPILLIATTYISGAFFLIGRSSITLSVKSCAGFALLTVINALDDDGKHLDLKDDIGKVYALAISEI
ncbi:hypothetical protein EIJ81_00240 (plasmid) [Aliivibrio salmonicida]|uniref:hypothetical protein n=1 Tax=Aliivibrio salmonicida TaxID=40269 RepID=UPI000F6EEE11|nr:hypothetical protein [Aliivibrio salmonicida]AZL83332.1 hypothetical protein EIJ81_00240 [Aliivibrio salmonicida]